MKTTMTTLASLALIAFSSPSLAKPGRGGGGHGQMKKVMKQLDLTEDQRKELRALKKGGKEDRKANREKHKAARKAFHEAMASSADEGALRSKFEALVEMRTAQMRKRFEHMLAIRKILTPEQRKKFATLMEEQKGKGRRGHRNDSDSEEFDEE